MKKRGFSLIELLITLAIIAILASIAIPAYQDYTKRAHYTEVVLATQPYKLGVSECYTRTASLTACNSGSNGVPKAISKAEHGVKSLAVAAGVITATPAAKNGIKETDVLVLTPTVEGSKLKWAMGGKAIDNGFV